MANLKNSVNPLSWNVPIVDKLGNATPEFQRKWEQQASTNGSIPDLTTAAAVSGVLDKVSATPGSLLARGASAWAGLAPSADGKILRDKGAGNAPIWDTLSNVVDLIGNVQGDVLYRSAAGWVALPPGTAGQVFTTGGPGANPAWSTASGGGGAASIQDDGTTIFIALSDTDGQLVLDGAGDPVFVAEANKAPTWTIKLAVETSTYSPPPGCTRIEVEMKAGGSGSAYCGVPPVTTNAAAGGDASFNGITAKGATAPSSSGAGVPGVGGTGGAGAAVWRSPGQSGFMPTFSAWDATTFLVIGGHGGGKGAPSGPNAPSTAGVAAPANTGAGAAGGNTPNNTAGNVASLYQWAGGGGEGETVFIAISNPVGPYSYTVPDGGAGGTGAVNGAKGGSGYIRIKEFYDRV